MRYTKFAVLGSNSFAGAVFVHKALSDGAQVIGFNRSNEGSHIFLPYLGGMHSHNYKFYRADINQNLDEILLHLDSFEPEVIVDFAGQGMVAESWQNPEQWYTTNIVSKVKLHNQLRSRNWLKRYVRVSTPEVYGSQDHIAKESWIYSPSTPYAVSHAAIDMSLKAFEQQYGFPVVFTRFANFYGPGQQLYRIIPRAIIYSLTNRKLQLQGGGKSVRAFIYADDIATGVMRASEFGVVGEAYHFSPADFITIRQVVETVCQKLGVQFDSMVELAPDRPGKDQAYLMDSAKSRNDLGWSDRFDFEQGVDLTIAWIKESMPEIQKLPLNYVHKI